MEEIIITGSASSRAKLDCAIGEAQSRARVRTITVEDIVKALADVEDQLGIPKTALEGVTVTVDLNAQKFPNAYSGIPESTHFQAVFVRRHWHVTDVWRGMVSAPHHMVDVTLSDTAKDELVSRFQSFAMQA